MYDGAKELLSRGRNLFAKKENLDSLHQQIADNFYPERAIFTVTRNLGDEFASHLMTSYPVMARRDLGNSFSAMLRRDDWFSLRLVDGEDRETIAALRWLEWAGKRMRRIMYERSAMFLRATKEGDHDFAAFGQCAISVELNQNADGMLYRCWHLKDMAWAENESGDISEVHRKWRPTAKMLINLFPATAHQTVRDCAVKDPFKEVECCHIVIPSSSYGSKFAKFPYVSVYIDVENECVLEEVGSWDRIYCIPRWQTVSGSQYSYSPATVIALPDARLLQQMTLVLLEAGEKAVNPPMVATSEAISGDISLYAGGITWTDASYDERMGDVLRPISQSTGGIPLGMEMRESLRGAMIEAFYLNKLSLPAGPEMTAYEVSQRVQEYIRQAMPIFEPMETEYNGQLCEMTFSKLIRAGAFGSPKTWPQEIQNAEYAFMFQSPLSEAIDRQKVGKLQESANLLATIAAADPGAVNNIDLTAAFRDALKGVGVPAAWIRPEDEVEKIDMAVAEQNAKAAMVQGASAVAGAKMNMAAAGMSE